MLRPRAERLIEPAGGNQRAECNRSGRHATFLEPTSTHRSRNDTATDDRTLASTRSATLALAIPGQPAGLEVRARRHQAGPDTRGARVMAGR